MARFAEKKPGFEGQPAAEFLTSRDQTVQDLMRFFVARGTPVSDAIRYGAFFVGFAVASLASAEGMAGNDAELQRLAKSAHDAVDEGMGAVRAALDSEIGRILRAHRLI